MIFVEVFSFAQDIETVRITVPKGGFDPVKD
jgi:hypothetical protein